VCVCVCVHVCELFKIILNNFLFKETKYIDDGRCMSVCTYVELNWFPEKVKLKNKLK